MVTRLTLRSFKHKKRKVTIVSHWQHTLYLSCNDTIHVPVVCLEAISTCCYDNKIKWRHHCTSVKFSIYASLSWKLISRVIGPGVIHSYRSYLRKSIILKTFMTYVSKKWPFGIKIVKSESIKRGGGKTGEMLCNKSWRISTGNEEDTATQDTHSCDLATHPL